MQLKKLFLKRDFQLPSKFSPDQFNSELAKRIDWKPNVEGGTIGKTYTIEKEANQLYVIKQDASAINKAFVILITALIFFPILPALLFDLVGIVRRGISFSEDPISLIFSGLFFLISSAFYSSFMKAFRAYKKLTIIDLEGKSLLYSKKVFELQQIKAIQIIKENCFSIFDGSGDNEFYSYEINLVVEDASRLTVIDQQYFPSIQTYSKELSEILEVPIWDPYNEI